MVSMMIQHIAFLLLVATHVAWFWHLVKTSKLATVQGFMWAVDIVVIAVLMWAHVEDMKRKEMK